MGFPGAIGSLLVGRRSGTVRGRGVPLLDRLRSLPQWAFVGSVAVRMRSGQPYAFRVRRDDGDELPVGFDLRNLTDLAALAGFCGAGSGSVVALYNAVLDPYVAEISQADPGAWPLVYSRGTPLLGVDGRLMVKFAGVKFLHAGWLGPTGDAALTVAHDLQSLDDDGFSTVGFYGASDSFAFVSDAGVFPGSPDTGYAYVGEDDYNAWAGAFPLGTGESRGAWFRASRLAGDPVSATVLRVDGSALTATDFGEPTHVLDLPADSQLGWGVRDASSSSYRRHFFVAGQLSGADEALLAEFEAANPPVNAAVSVTAPATAIAHGTASGAVGAAARDGTPPYSYAWELLSGPGSLTFEDASAAATIATPGAADGDYLLRVTVTDAGGGSAAAETTLTRMAAGATVASVLGADYWANFDAHDLANGAVASWPSTGLDATALAQATSGKRPVRSATGFAPESVALPGVAFDRVNDIVSLVWGSPIPAGNRPYMWLAMWDRPQTSPGQILAVLGDDGAGQFLSLVVQTNGDFQASARGGGVGPFNQDSGVYMSNRVDGSIVEVGYADDPFFAGADGAMMVPSTPVGAPALDFAKLTLGAGPSESFFSQVVAGRLVVASDAPTIPQRAQVRAILAATWRPPIADAGTPRWIPHGDAGSVTLLGIAAGIAPFVYQWSLVSGPGSATFGSPAALETTATVGAADGDYTCRLTVTDSTGATATSDVVVRRLADSAPFLLDQLAAVSESPIFAVANKHISRDTAAWTGFAGGSQDYPTADLVGVTEESEMQAAFGASNGWAFQWLDQGPRHHHLQPGDRGHSPPNNDAAVAVYDGASGHALKVGSNLRAHFDGSTQAMGCIGTGGAGGPGGITGDQAFTVALLFRAGAIASEAGPFFLGERVNNLQSLCVVPLSTTSIKLDFVSASVTFACADVTALNYLVIEHPAGGDVASVTVRQNGVALTPTSVVNGSAVPDIFPSITNLALNDNGAGHTGVHWQGDVLAALTWDHALGAGDARDLVEAWCQDQVDHA